MDKLVELLKQIQELAGVAIDALEGAMSDSGDNGGKPPEEGPPPGGPPPGAPAGDQPPPG